jgi:hypothetical protein
MNDNEQIMKKKKKKNNQIKWNTYLHIKVAHYWGKKKQQ